MSLALGGYGGRGPTGMPYCSGDGSCMATGAGYSAGPPIISGRMPSRMPAC